MIEGYAVNAALILETRYTTIPLWHLQKIASAIGALYDNATERYVRLTITIKFLAALCG